MLKTCAYKIGNRLILKLSLFSKKVIIKKSEYSLKEKGESQNKVRLSWLTRPLLGTATVLRLKEQSSVLCIAWKMRLFSFKKKGTVGGIRLCAASLHCPSAFLYSFRLISRETGNPSYRGS